MYREVVRERGEMQRWDGLKDGVRVWWRKFRGGMLMGKRRSNWWKEEKCDVCKKEGGVGHFIFRCEDEGVGELKRAVLTAVEERLVGEEKERWKEMSGDERMWGTLGMIGEEFLDVRVRGAEVWREEWDKGMWGERVG